MSMPHYKTALAALTATLLVSACSAISLGNEEKKAAEAEEKAGRIDMVLGDELLEANPDLAGVEIELPEPQALAAWPQSGARASKSVGHIAAGEAFEIAWSVNAGEGSDRKGALTAPPVTNATTIFVLDSRHTIRAFDLESGSRQWSRELKSGSKRDRLGIGGAIGLEGDTLVVSSSYGYVAALDAADGSERWRRELGTPMTGAPTIRNGRIFVSSNNNDVFSLDLATGTVEWTDQAISETARVLSAPSPAAVEDIVVAPFSSGEIIAYLASNGQRLWDDALTRSGRFTPISAINDVASRPVLARAGERIIPEPLTVGREVGDDLTR